jgi:hypothetical protein
MTKKTLIILLCIAALLLSACTTPPLTEGVGLEPAEYERTLAAMFRREAGELLRSYGVPSATASAVADDMLTAFARARVPSDKIFKAAEYFVVLRMGLPAFSPGLDALMLGAHLLLDFSDNTGILPADLAKAVYEFLLLRGSAPLKTSLTTMGRSNFVILTANTLIVLTQSADYPEDVARELRFALGYDYLRIVDEVGIDVLEDALGLGNDFAAIASQFPADAEIIVGYLDIMQSLKGFIGPFFIYAGQMLMTDGGIELASSLLAPQWAAVRQSLEVLAETLEIEEEDMPATDADYALLIAYLLIFSMFIGG